MIGWDGLFLGAVYGYVYGAWAAIGADDQIYYNEIWEDPNAWLDNDWHHLAMTFYNSTYTRSLYLDGQLVVTDILDPAEGAGYGYWEGEFVVGGRQDYYEAAGLAADAKVWDTALSPQEILAEYDALMALRRVRGDISMNGCVNFEDFAKLANDWLGSGP
jgi:hypothetical protein